MQCANVNALLNESGLMRTKIGNGFQGYMYDLIVSDYAKEEVDINRRIKTTGCVASDAGHTCPRCPIETGQCIVRCDYNQYVNSTTGGCTDCYASCRSCWDAFYESCMSCVKAPGVWTFDYVNTCSSTCGDGVRDDYEECDDSNTANGDGCSSTCTVEPGFKCGMGSF